MNKNLPTLNKPIRRQLLTKSFWINSNNPKFLNETLCKDLCIFSSICYALLCYSYDLLIFLPFFYSSMMILKQPKCLMITQILKCPIKSILK